MVTSMEAKVGKNIDFLAWNSDGEKTARMWE